MSKALLGWVTKSYVNSVSIPPTITFKNGESTFVSLVLAVIANLANDTKLNLREVLNDFYKYSEQIGKGQSWEDMEPVLEHFINHLIEKMPPEDKIIFKIEREDGNKR